MLILATVLVAIVACGNRGNQAPADLQVALTPAPGGMAGDHLIVHLADASGVPITDAAVSLEGNMNHPGMVPVLTTGVVDEADGQTDGNYRIPFQFTMLGDWIITVRITRPDGAEIKHDIDLQVQETTVTIKE